MADYKSLDEIQLLEFTKLLMSNSPIIAENFDQSCSVFKTVVTFLLFKCYFKCADEICSRPIQGHVFKTVVTSSYLSASTPLQF